MYCYFLLVFKIFQHISEMNTSQLTVLQIITQNLKQYLVLAIRMSFLKKNMIYRNQTQSHPARKHFHNRHKSYLQQMHPKQELVINDLLSPSSHTKQQHSTHGSPSDKPVNPDVSHSLHKSQLPSSFSLSKCYNTPPPPPHSRQPTQSETIMYLQVFFCNEKLQGQNLA